MAGAMLVLCLCLSMGTAPATIPFGKIATFYRAAITVDGLPVYVPEVMIWNGQDWVYYDSDEGLEARSGLRSSGERKE